MVKAAQASEQTSGESGGTGQATPPRSISSRGIGGARGIPPLEWGQLFLFQAFNDLHEFSWTFFHTQNKKEEKTWSDLMRSRWHQPFVARG